MMPERHLYSSPEEIADFAGYRERVTREIVALRKERDALSAQVTALREALVRQMGTHNMVNTRTRDLCACEACRIAQQALALPPDAA